MKFYMWILVAVIGFLSMIFITEEPNPTYRPMQTDHYVNHGDNYIFWFADTGRNQMGFIYGYRTNNAKRAEKLVELFETDSVSFSVPFSGQAPQRNGIVKYKQNKTWEQL